MMSPSFFARRAPAWLLWVLAAGVLSLDRLAKIWVQSTLAAAHSREVLGDFLRFTYVRNPGVAFGLFADRGGSLGWLSLVALAAVLWLALRAPSKAWPRSVALGLILGGALGNLYDRLRWGSVVDFIDVGIGPHRFWTFNVADSAITVGVIVWAAHLLWGRGDEDQASAPAGSAPADSPSAASTGSPDPVDHARGA
jgi:signal peptidase II